MPLRWKIESKERLLTVIAEGDVTRPEVDALLDTIERADLFGYRKLFDGIGADTTMGPDNILALGVRMRTHHADHAVGPLAIAVPDDKVALISRVLGMLAAARRPLRVFHEVEAARDWILKQPH